MLAMVEKAKLALTQAGTKLLTLKRRLDEVSHEQADLLDILLSNMADADLNARMKALTDEKASLKEQILEAQQEEVGLEEQVDTDNGILNVMCFLSRFFRLSLFA